MTEPQLSVRSARARDLAHKLARQTRRTIAQIVEEALQDYQAKLLAGEAATPLDRAWALAAADRAGVPAGTTSAHGDLYDDEGHFKSPFIGSASHRQAGSAPAKIQ